MFRRHQQLRRWALRVLLVWLFGLGLGVANACLAAQQFAGGGDTFHGKAEALAADFAVAAAACEHSVAAPDRSEHDPGERSPKSNCESFCERAGVTIPPQKSVLDNYQFHVLPLPVVAALTVPPSVDVSAGAGAPRRDGARPLPIPIAFLRLAL
jgi:hypothetical protein